MLRETLRGLGPIAWRDARIAELTDKVRDQRLRLEARTAKLKVEARDQRRRLNARIVALEGEVRDHQQRLADHQQRLADHQQRLADQRQRLDDLRKRVSVLQRYRPTVASWHGRIMEQQRVQHAVNALDGAEQHPRHNLFRKLHNYEVARSHGIATPQVLGVWPEIADVEWDALPDQFVLKSDGGSTGRGVLPLERTEGGFRLVDGTRTYSAEAIVDHYTRAGAAARPPYFAETLLAGSGERLPDDVKIYAFYGEVAYVMLRRMPVHADISQGLVRTLTATGEDLSEVQRGRTPVLDLPVPQQLPLMVDTAVALSLALPVPYVRVDLYAAGDHGVVLGELTPLPGDSQTFTGDWDRRLGAMYDEAEARLQVDLADGQPFGVLYGGHDRTLTTPVAPTTSASVLPGRR